MNHRCKIFFRFFFFFTIAISKWCNFFVIAKKYFVGEECLRVGTNSAVGGVKKLQRLCSYLPTDNPPKIKQKTKNLKQKITFKSCRGTYIRW